MSKPIISDIIFPWFFYYLSVYAKPPLEQRHLSCRKTSKLSSGNDDTAAFFKKNLLPFVYGKWGLGRDRKIFLRVAKTGETERQNPSFFSRPPADDDEAALQTRHTHYVFPAVSRKKSGAQIHFSSKKKGKRLWVRTFLVPCLYLSSFTYGAKLEGKPFFLQKCYLRRIFLFFFSEKMCGINGRL